MAVQSVQDTIRALFPRGTIAEAEPPYSWESFPVDPADAFGVAAILLERAGCYQQIPPNTCGFSCETPPSGDPFGIAGANQFELRVRATAWAYGYPFEPDGGIPERQAENAENIRRAIEQFRWRFDGYPDAYLEEAERRLPQVDDKEFRALWGRLIACTDPVSLDPAVVGDPPAWWKDAIQLLIMADEAASGMGFITPADKPVTRAQERAMARMASSGSFQLAPLLDADVAGVLPKTRTPMVGCTPRSLSHHLCLAPARGRVAVEWLPRQIPWEGDVHDPFNVLLIPFPYVMRAGWLTARNDGFFHIEQGWLRGNVRTKIITLVDEIISDSDKPPHAIVLPEFSLDWDTFTTLSEHIRKKHREVEVLMAGVGDYDGQPGNYVATWLRDLPGYYVRSKHHRWRIDERQLRKYGMNVPSGPGVPTAWWEDIQLGRRAVQFFPLRNRSVFTALICEDLARIEPCQAIIRGVGPNLVFVLLMDGGQIPSRWPNQYAGVLAEDPGSSVLTLTSLGLLSRISAGSPAGRRSIALWRDPNALTEISLREGEIASLLSLEPESIEEYSLDGRSDGGAATAWRLSNVVPIRQRVDQEWVYETPRT